MAWNHPRGGRRRRFKEDPDRSSVSHGRDTLELSAMAASAFVVLVVAVASAGMFGAASRQLSPPLEDARGEVAAAHDVAVERSHEFK
jgi:hypothetical protein